MENAVFIGLSQQMALKRRMDITANNLANEGEFTRTGRPLDIAISGDGYFSIETPDGVRYTRNGSFRLDTEGTIVSINNQPLLDENGRTIKVDVQFQDVSIAPDGTITTGEGQTQKIDVVK